MRINFYILFILHLVTALVHLNGQRLEVSDDEILTFVDYTQGNSTENESIPDVKCTKDVHTIHNSADLAFIFDCKVLDGDVLVSNYKEPIIQFGDIQAITGSLTVRGAPNLVRIEAPSIGSIGNVFSLRELTSLALISFPALRTVKELDWKILPILSTVHVNNEISGIESIIVSDTSLTKFSGFISNELSKLDLNNNRFLESIQSNVEKITGELHIAANSANVAVDLSRLKSAQNLTIQETASLDLSKLEQVENSVSFIANTFKQLKVPKLRSVGGTLSISENPYLNHLEFNSIDDIGGGLVIVNNTSIEKINFFPKLSIIGGAMELVGYMKEISLKQLKLVKGSAKIQAFADQFDCSKWTKSEVGSVIRGGRIECTNSKDEKIVEIGNGGDNEMVNSTTEKNSTSIFDSLRFKSQGNKLSNCLRHIVWFGIVALEIMS